MPLSDRDRRIAALAWPALGGLAVEPLYVLIDTAIIGRLGTVPLGGLAVASAVLVSLLWVFNFLSYGTTARVAFLEGRGDERSAGEVALQGLWICAMAGLPLALFIATAAGLLAGILGGDGEVLDAATTYLRISALGVPAVLVALVGQGYLRGRSNTLTPFLVLAIANGMNVVLDLVLVYGLDLGIAGSAIGTVIAQWGAAAWFLVLLVRSATGTGASRRFDWTEIRRLVVVGRHLFTRTAALLATLALSTAVAARVGAATLAGHQIALQIETFLALVVDSLAIPAQALVGTSLGARDVGDAQSVSWRLLGFGVRVGVVIGVVVAATSFVLPRAFSTDPDVIRVAGIALLVVALMQVPGSIAFVLDGVMMGASDFRFLQRAMFVATLGFVPFAVAVLIWNRLGILGIWAGLATWMTVRAATNYARFRSDAWTHLAST